MVLQKSSASSISPMLPVGSNLFNGASRLRPRFLYCQDLARPPCINLSQNSAIRWLSSDGKPGSDGNRRTSAEERTQNTAADQAKTSKEESSGEGQREKLDPRTFLLGTTARLRRVAEFQGQLGDEIATYAIVVLLGLIILAPIMGQYMRRSDNEYDELDTDDQVVDMARIVKRDFLDKISEGSLEDKGVVHTVIGDVLASKSLQEQAIKFVVTIVQSDQVKAACQKLLKELWNDLIKDPETAAQVIFLLNAAIENPDIRLAVKKLVLDIVEDEEVLEELVRMLQKLGEDQEVLDATKTLLTESAHNALNDPDILDHSMEFATDVVGDDVVQRTAGEALRNTLSYAVQPGMTILFAAAGVGLLFFSVMSLGYARSSEQDAKVLDQAVSGLARSLQPSPRLTDRLWNVITLPFRAISTAVEAVFTTVLLPFHLVQRTVAQMKYTSQAASKAATTTTAWLVGNIQSTYAWVTTGATALSTSVNHYGNVIINFILAPISWLSGSGRNSEQSTTKVTLTETVVAGLSDTWSSVPRETKALAWVSLDRAAESFRLWQSYFPSLFSSKRVVGSE
ncbi:expressed unknown protein [Seminavis robusta]|uniref:Uncharacterized protein n=1 Tax=Seminavis robusta TaxID=568900 RepID=A0A9N8DIN5_9STRA|nr:expressed unknown protein [Seminavis robusta]|eukprot:Sro83_g044270.1 n/a (568) ;mRNA; f:36933-38786